MEQPKIQADGIDNNGYTMRLILGVLITSSFVMMLLVIAISLYARYGCFGRRTDSEIADPDLPLDTLHPAQSGDSPWSNFTIATAGVTPTMEHSVTVVVVDDESRVVDYH